MARKMRDLICDKCKTVVPDQYVDIDKLPPHQDCGGKWCITRVNDGRANGVIPDDIPGGIKINHLLTHEDGSAKTWYTRSSIRQAAKEKGYTWGYDVNKHIPDRGSDKNKFTSKW